ncbi:MAG: hypothetical protein GXO19_03740 [Epsilonproteobacteria bacterium]|nr:hypothetical protein [Campylobacterota bacterium]NPA56832.1 hypothetical protein [Campylobacterota bacterium]
MKRLFLLCFAFLLSFAGYSGFMEPKPGAWAKYKVLMGKEEGVTTVKYLGESEYKGKKVNVVEIETLIEGLPIVTQQWSAVDDESIVKKVITKTPQGTICMSEEMYRSMGSDEGPDFHLKTPKEYSPKKPVKQGTYTLPNGKKVEVAIFKDGEREVWVSSQVPFGIVKVVEDGKVVMELIDFGLEGAKAKIPLKEAATCTPTLLPFPML